MTLFEAIPNPLTLILLYDAIICAVGETLLNKLRIIVTVRCDAMLNVVASSRGLQLITPFRRVVLMEVNIHVFLTMAVMPAE